MPFTDEGLADRLRLAAGDPRRDQVRVTNPMGGDQALLRSLLFPGLLDAARRNLDLGEARVALFETGRVMLPLGRSELPDQPVRDGGSAGGRGRRVLPRQGRRRDAGGGAAHAARRAGGRAAVPASGALGGAWLRRSSSASSHPLVAEEYGIEATVGVFEIDLSELEVTGTPLYRDVVTFPPLRQDIAVVVDADLPAGELIAAVREAGGELLDGAEVFDVYTGAQVGEGRKSLAVHLVFRAADRTLTDAEADAARGRIVAALAERFGAALRG